MKKLSVKRMCFLSMLVCILFVQEQLLSGLPNIQLTVLLIMLYGDVLGKGYGSVVILIHVLLDNLYMGSFTPIVIIPMLIGWLFTLLMGSIVKNTNVYVKAGMSALCAIIYSLSFAFFNTLFLHIDLHKYIIADIPFVIALCASSAISILFLYEPLKKALQPLYNKTK